jgi:opacity protein-like surface antigen
MRAPTSSHARRIAGAALAAAVAIAGSPGGTRGAEVGGDASAHPALLATTGKTFGISGDVTEGGPAFRLAVMWPLEQRQFSTGVEVSADDFGNVIGELLDPNNGEPLGRTQQVHRAAYGVAWRFDAGLAPDSKWDPYVSGTWGLSRVRDDSLGVTKERWAAVGIGAGAGVRRAFGKAFTIGAALRYQLLFNDRVGRFASASLEWGWR